MSRVDPMLMAVMMAAGLASLAMAMLAWRRRSSAPSVVWLVVVLIGVAEVLIPYALSYDAIFDALTKVWLINITYIGWLVVPPAFLVYLARLTGRDGWLTPAVRVILVAVPLLFVPVIWGPGADDLFFGGGRSLTDFNFPASSPLYVAFIAYTYLLLAGSVLLVVVSARRSTRLHPAQSMLLVIVAVVPWVLSLGSFVNIRVFGADPTVLSLIVVAGMAFGVSQFPTFDLRPMTEAESQLASDSGVVVVDHAGRLAEMNSTAARLLGPGISPAMGFQLEQVWVHQPAVVAALHGADLGGIPVPSASGEGLLEFEYAPIVEPSGRRSGTLVLIRERAVARDG